MKLLFYAVSPLLTMQTAVIARGDLSVFLSVCPSVTFQCFVLRSEDTIVQSALSGRTIVLVSGELNFIRIFAGGTPSEGIEVKRPLSLVRI